MHSADEILELLSVVYATGDTLEVSCINLHCGKKTKYNRWGLQQSVSFVSEESTRMYYMSTYRRGPHAHCSRLES
jgi:hypothetical protein